MNIKQFTPEYLSDVAHKAYMFDRLLPENFSYWYPKILDFGQFKHANIISNQVFTESDIDILQKTDSIEKVNWEEIDQVLKPTLDKMKPYKYYSIKNGTFSNKFQFNTCLTTKYNLSENFWKIQYQSCMYDTGGYTEIVVRDAIPYNMFETPTIYEGLPLRPELRVFYSMKDKKILYTVNYWDYDYCINNINVKSDKIVFEWFSKRPETTERLKELVDIVYKYIDNVKFSSQLTGIWSIDFMYVTDMSDDINGVYLIDMARAERSAYYDVDKIKRG